MSGAENGAERAEYWVSGNGAESGINRPQTPSFAPLSPVAL